MLRYVTCSRYEHREKKLILLYCQVISVCYHLTINIKQELYGVTKFYSLAINPYI